eukprot:GHVP01024941.1.p1 GENE.GHVP01024941.1~~GHVP01024941.1.p1  ORF type:complete len:898 (+),score=134.68 GHVP01024941.1:2-2695(+)
MLNLDSYFSDEMDKESLLESAKEISEKQLLYSIWVYDNRIQESDMRIKLSDAILELMKADLVKINDLITICEPDTLENLNIVESGSGFHRILVRKNTNRFYRQKRYNLFKEEPYGYASLIVSFNEFIENDFITEEYQYKAILSLIGRYDLEATRVNNILLNNLSFSIEDKNDKAIKKYYTLFKRFDISKDRLIDILNLDFKYSSKHTTLIKLCVFLVKEEVLQLEDVRVFMESTPELEAMVKKLSESIPKIVTKTVLKNETRNNYFNSSDILGQITSLAIGTFASVFLEEGMTELTISIIKEAPEVIALDKELSINLFKYLSILPIFNENNTIELLLIIGSLISVNERLFIRTVELANELNENDEIRFLFILKVLIPAFVTLEYHSDEVISQFWSLLSLISSEKRFEIYGKWVSANSKQSLDLVYASSMGIKRTKSLIKRLTEENIPKIADDLRKETDYFSLIETLLSSAKAYESLLNPIISVVLSFNSLAIDILTFFILKGLKNEPQKIKEDGTFLTQNYKTYIIFLTSIIIKSRKADFSAILNNISNLMGQADSFAFCILEQLFKEMNEDIEKSFINLLLKHKMYDCIKSIFINLTAQKNELILECDETRYPKHASWLIDTCNKVFNRFSDIIMKRIPIDTYINIIPSIGDLIKHGSETMDIYKIYSGVFPFYTKLKEKVLVELWKREKTEETEGVEDAYKGALEYLSFPSSQKVFQLITDLTEAERIFFFSKTILRFVLYTPETSKMASNFIKEYFEWTKRYKKHFSPLTKSLIVKTNLILAGSTDEESKNYGYFLREILKMLIIANPHTEIKLMEQILICLDKKEHLLLRNTIVFILEISPVFPSDRKTEQELSLAIDTLVNNEEREDIQTLASQCNIKIKTKISNKRKLNKE